MVSIFSFFFLIWQQNNLWEHHLCPLSWSVFHISTPCYDVSWFKKNPRNYILFSSVLSSYKKIVKLGNLVKQSFIPHPTLYWKFYSLVLMKFLRFTLCLWRENYLVFFASQFLRGCFPESHFKVAQGFVILSWAAESFLNLFGHYPNIPLKSCENLFYFSSLGFGKGCHLQASDRWVCSFFRGWQIQFWLECTNHRFPNVTLI